MLKFYSLFLLVLLASCYKAERNCKDFKIGKFKSEVVINGIAEQTFSIRTEKWVIETYKGATDTSKIHWINDCEYVLRKLNPKSMVEKQAIAIKILSTTENSYTFEFGIVGQDQKQKGTATKL